MAGIIEKLLGRNTLDTLIETSSNVEVLLRLVKQAHNRFTDNDMQPPNHALEVWLRDAEAAITNAERGKYGND